MKCSNEKCKKNPLNSMDCVVVNVDGDLACNENCKKEYEKQRDYFFDNISDDNFYNNWLNEDLNWIEDEI